MSTRDRLNARGANELGQNFHKINLLLQRLFLALGRRELRNPGVEGPGQPFLMRAALGQANALLTNPLPVMAASIEFWKKTAALHAEMTRMILQGGPPPAETETDARFRDEEWASHPLFYYLKRQYQILSSYLDLLADEADGEDAPHAGQVRFFTRQLLDLFAPSNFLASNPVALKRAVDTHGASLVQGLENLVSDIERAGGDILVTLSDPSAFEVGVNLATAKGAVVFETELFQILRYAPSTETVLERPLLIIPPWINKYYILDLTETNSMVRWLTSRGFMVHIVSWKNADASMREFGMDTYVFDGILKAAEIVDGLCGRRGVNITGYCIGGTGLALALAWAGKTGFKSPIRSATFFTALTDFTDPGQLGMFIDETFISGIEIETRKKGFLDNRIMARTFSFLRPNDLVYGPAVKAYLLGEPRPKFDLLFWNEDSTRLPERMALEYLRRLYRDNEFARGVYDIGGVAVQPGDIAIPHYVVACEKDHIAPWRSSFAGLAKASGSGRFVLAQSGHIAGVINPPEKRKYGYWVSDKPPHSPDSWRETTTAADGSWWPDWASWLSRRSGKRIDAAASWREEARPIEPAPGRYVLE
jgi:polyhydroxyalkanoate synthase